MKSFVSKALVGSFAVIVAVGLSLSLPASAIGQQDAAAQTQVTNPVTSTVKAQMPRFAKNMVAAAEAMPAEKYGFKPNSDMSTYGHLVLHILQTNNFLCAKASGAAAPEVSLAETDAKDKLVAGLKASFDFCSTALANVDDSKLSDPLVLFGNRPSSRAGALIGLSDGWFDHYSTQAMYLRLNGILPPSAQPPATQPAKQ
jgi:DinB superfamily